MKRINFSKLTGAGNDFIVIQAQKGLNYKSFTKKVCHRTQGIGADGVLILDKSKKSDYKMRIINADGSEAEMCGNGARCMAVYIKKYKKPNKKLFTIDTLAGEIEAQTDGQIAEVKLGNPINYKSNISLSLNGKNVRVHTINTGVPHVIVYVKGLANIDVNSIGEKIRFNKEFAPRGTNVNFVERLKNKSIEVRTYERGVESETRACGTGSVASAIVTHLRTNSKSGSKKKSTVKVKTASGEILDVSFLCQDNHIEDVWLKGSAKFIAEGAYYV